MIEVAIVVALFFLAATIHGVALAVRHYLGNFVWNNVQVGPEWVTLTPARNRKARLDLNRAIVEVRLPDGSSLTPISDGDYALSLPDGTTANIQVRLLDELGSTVDLETEGYYYYPLAIAFEPVVPIYGRNFTSVGIRCDQNFVSPKVRWEKFWRASGATGRK